MSREGVEVVASLGNPTATVNNTLATIDHNVSTHSVSCRDDRFEVGHRTKRIRGLGYGHHLSTLVDKLRKHIHPKLAALIEGQYPKLSTTTCRSQLPGHDIRVVLHLRDNDVIARAKIPRTPSIGDKIYRCSSSCREDNLLAMLSTYKPTHLLARRLIHLGHSARQVVNTTMDVGVTLAHKALRSLYDAQRLLCRSATVEVDQWALVDLEVENREIATYSFYIVGHIVYYSLYYNLLSFAESNSVSTSSRPSIEAWSTTSSTKPSICRRLASARLRPR